MKLLSIISFGLFFTAAAFAADCPNFSGQYLMASSPSDPAVVNLTIEQMSCEKLVAHYQSGDGKKFDRPMVVDGQMHPTVVTNAFTVSEAFSWHDGGLTYQQEIQSQGNVTRSMGAINLINDALVEETIYLGSNNQPAYRERVEFQRKH